MRKIILYIATSADGFIAGQNGDLSWLHQPKFALDGEDFGYGALLESVDTTLMGYRTYDFVRNMDMPFPYSGMKNFVITAKRDRRPNQEVEFITDDIPGFCQDLKQQKGLNIWLIGGGQLNSILLNARLIDEIILTTIPVILGKGIPVFDGSAEYVFLKCDHSKTYSNGFIQSVYYPKYD